MKPLTLLVDTLFQKATNNWHIKLRADWPHIMGDLSKRARLERVNGSTVVIGVYDSHWMHELHALSRMILFRMNSVLGPSYPPGFTLTALRCIWVHQQDKKKKEAPVNEVPQKKQVQPGDRILRSVEKITSQELQDSLVAYYIRCKQEGR